MKRILLTAAMVGLMLLLPPIGAATGFKVTKVVEVGPASNLAYIGALAWSLDGSKLAFFSGGSFYVSDTLGNVDEVGSSDISPQRLEWWTEQELIFVERHYPAAGEAISRLHTLDIRTGGTSLLEEYHYFAGKGEQHTFEGPYKSQYGRPYYISVSPDKKSVVRSLTDDKSLQSDVLFEVSGDNLTSISNDFMDTTTIGLLQEKGRIRFSIKSSFDGQYFLANYNLYNLSDSSSISLPGYAKEQLALDVDACSVGINTHFNPVYDELMIELSCETFGEDVHSPTEYVFTVLYDLTKGTFQNLSSALNSDNCGAPSFSPDGLKIAVLSNNTAFIIYRELTQ